MGLSASQARLLSLTSRISQNELRAEQVTRSKQALAQETADLAKKYVNSLNANELTYAIYDQNGEKTCMELTGAALSQYAPLKNQYALVNAHGQVLVSELDAANYEKSADINEFLACYGIDPIPTGETRTVAVPGAEAAYDEWQDGYDEWKSREPQKTDPVYWTEETNPRSQDLYDKFLRASRGCYFSALRGLSNALGYEPPNVIYDSKGVPVIQCFGPGEFSCESWVIDDDGNTVPATLTNEYQELWVFYDENGDYHVPYGPYSFPGWTNPSGNLDFCYGHVFSHMLPLGTHTTCLGDTVNIQEGYSSSGPDGNDAHWWEHTSPITMDRGKEIEEFATLLDTNSEEYLCCAEDGTLVSLDTWNKAMAGNEEAKVQVLMGDYYYDASGTSHIKTIQQKAIDLDYLCWHYRSYPGYDGTTAVAAVTPEWYDQALWDSMQHFVEHDLKYAFSDTKEVFDEGAYDDDYGEWLSQEPEPFDGQLTAEEQIYTYGDTDEAQWYVNLWHRMNGESQQKDGYTTNQFGTTVSSMNGYFTNQKRWDILEDGLMNNAKWLKYALESGAVTIERVEFADPNEMGTGIRKTKWNSIIYTNAADIGTQTNQKIAAKNQAEFERKQKALTTKDKQYDSILKLLDTEHNTLLQEYETAKSVVTKNTERTLKLYS